MKLMHLLRAAKKSLSAYQPLIEVFISKENLLHNLHEYQKQYPHVQFAPVLKSNAYGHGFVPIAHILEKETVPFIALDSLYEAATLRDEGCALPILILAHTHPENIQTNRLKNIAFTITNLEHLRQISHALKRQTHIHIKIDTGMHRHGLETKEIPEAIRLVKANPSIVVDGICSHFADADGMDPAFTQKQISQWNTSITLFKEPFPTIPHYHLTASAGAYYAPQIQQNIARLGIGLYGVNFSPFSKLDLKPVLRMESKISSIKTIEAGESIGYNATYRADRPTKVATVPVGYFEGVDRRLSNKGYFLVNGVECPILGRISMNITCFDVSNVPDVRMGDRVIIISDRKDDKNSIESIAKLTETIPYEIFVHIPQHLRRVVR